MKSECHKSYGHEWWGEQYLLIGGRLTRSVIYYHRIDGPAIIFDNGDKYYYILNKRISEEQFNTPGFIDAFILENS